MADRYRVEKKFFALSIVYLFLHFCLFLAEAGLRAAALNVLINLGSIKDEVFVGQERLKLMALLSGKPELKERVLKEVETKL